MTRKTKNGSRVHVRTVQKRSPVQRTTYQIVIDCGCGKVEAQTLRAKVDRFLRSLEAVVATPEPE